MATNTEMAMTSSSASDSDNPKLNGAFTCKSAALTKTTMNVASNACRKKFINFGYRMIGVSRDATPTQVNMILREVYMRDNRFVIALRAGSFAIPSDQSLRRRIVTNPPNWTKSRSGQRVKSSSVNEINSDRVPHKSAQILPPSIDDILSSKSSQTRTSSREGGLQLPVDFPLTSSKTIGWVVSRELRSSDRWRRPRVTCPVVKFAEIYFEQNRINPFKHRSF